MSIPNSRETFAKYCLTKLGSPVINIDVSDDQIDDRIDEALKYFIDYHYDGTLHTYYAYQVTQTDINNKYILMPDNIIGVIDIFDIGFAMGDNNMFNVQYQFALNNMSSMNTMQMLPYFMIMQDMQFIDYILMGKKPLRYNRMDNILHIDMDWNMISVGQYIVVEAYAAVNPDINNKLWGDRFLAKYATALIKRQWGQNLTKFSNMKLTGDIQFNGDKIFNDAEKELEKLEKEMINNYMYPARDTIG